MKVTKLTAVAVCCAMSTMAMAQHDAPKMDPKKEIKKIDGQVADKKGDMPAMSEEEKAWMDAATPGEMHAWIAKTAGTWDLKVKTMMPGQPVSESTSTCTTTLMMDGRFAHSVVKGEFKWGEMTVPFEGAGTMGYNNTTKQFEGTWMDNMGTMTLFMTGELDAGKKVLTMKGNMVCPMNNKPCTMKNVLTVKGDNEMVEEFYNDMYGPETKVMEITYTRAKGGKADKGAMGKVHDEVKKATDELKKQMPSGK